MRSDRISLGLTLGFEAPLPSILSLGSPWGHPTPAPGSPLTVSAVFSLPVLQALLLGVRLDRVVGHGEGVDWMNRAHLSCTLSQSQMWSWEQGC